MTQSVGPPPKVTPIRAGGKRVRKRFDQARREELLDGVMQIFAERGFSKVRTAQIARELHCSEGTLYKIAPSKDSLVVLALSRWGELVLANCEAQALRGATASDRAQRYYRAGTEGIRPLSHAFRRDVEHFESTRRAYREISDRFVDRFTALLEEAAKAGEIRPVNARFMAGTLRYIAFAIRDEDLLEAAGLTAGEAHREIEAIIWDGLQARSVVGLAAPGEVIGQRGRA
jgi:AcrR family transcriptional regulator